MNYDLSFIHVPETEPGPIPSNDYDSGRFVVKNGFLTYTGDAPSYIGVDVSSHQKQIDWTQVAGAGVDFAHDPGGLPGLYCGQHQQGRLF